jgi:hypothetical protein
MKFEVWSRDQYGRNEILSILNKKGKSENEWVNIDDAFEAAKRFVHDKNRNNPMTFDEQKRQVTYVLPVFGDVDEPYGIYAGNLVRGIQKVVDLEEDEERNLRDDDEVVFYVGQTPDDEPWLLSTPRGKHITDFESQDVVEKAVVFVHAQ